ncbi:MAG: recombinase family protein [Dehalococcoidia bacterium]
MSSTALYARVSSDRQEKEATVASQLDSLHARMRQDGISGWDEFIDEGYSRDNLARPALDRLRDRADRGEIRRLYVHVPDRLGSGVVLMMLHDELRQLGMEVIFIHGSVEDSPEGDMHFGMQAVFADYERRKTAERTSRGKLYWAAQGALVAGIRPYGYRFIRGSGNHSARLDIHEQQAQVVRDIYRWLTEEGLSTRAIAKRLGEHGVPTARGSSTWRTSTVGRILRNTVYRGELVYRRTERIERRADAGAGEAGPYRREKKTRVRRRPEPEWMVIPVPALIDRGAWERAQAQLDANQRLSKRNTKRHEYLLRGLIRCSRCQNTYTGAAKDGIRRYRCTRNDPLNTGDGIRCRRTSIMADPVEDAVWDAITEAMLRPDLITSQYRMHVQDQAGEQAHPLMMEMRSLKAGLNTLKRREDRLTDAYLSEVMDLEMYGSELKNIRSEQAGLERRLAEMEQASLRQETLDQTLESVEAFCRTVAQGLEALTFDERQRLLQLLVERIDIEGDLVRISGVIPPVAPSGGTGELRPCHPERSEGSHLAYQSAERSRHCGFDA